MRRPVIANVVANSLFHFNGQKYELGDFVVMPNHVHLLVVFPDPLTMKNQCTSWMRFTATEINRIVGRHGAFWQEEPFDHLYAMQNNTTQSDSTSPTIPKKHISSPVNTSIIGVRTKVAGLSESGAMPLDSYPNS